MKLKRVGGENNCGSGSCPNVFETDRGTYVVQGYKVEHDVRAEIALAANEDAVEIPKDLIDKIMAASK